MRGPGARAGVALSRALSGQTREHVVDPIIADMQLEHARACARGRRARAAWILARGHAHLLHALALVIAWEGLEAARYGLRRFGAAMLAAALLTFALFFGLATITRTSAVRGEAQIAAEARGSVAPPMAVPQAENIRAPSELVR